MMKRFTGERNYLPLRTIYNESAEILPTTFFLQLLFSSCSLRTLKDCSTQCAMEGDLCPGFGFRPQSGSCIRGSIKDHPMTALTSESDIIVFLKDGQGNSQSIRMKSIKIPNWDSSTSCYARNWRASCGGYPQPI